MSATGKTYEAVLIRRVTDTGLDIRHSRGSTRLRYDQLPADYRSRFQWDSAVAEAAFTQEEKDEILRERLNIIVQRQDEQKKEAAAAAAATEKRLKDLENRLASRTSEKAFISRLGSSGKLGERAGRWEAGLPADIVPIATTPARPSITTTLTAIRECAVPPRAAIARRIPRGRSRASPSRLGAPTAGARA